MATRCLIIADSQGKYFPQYLEPSLDYQVTVDSVSGRKIQDVDCVSATKTETFQHIIIHLGTNNVPREGPATTAKRMEELMTAIRLKNPSCALYISSVLPRAISKFQVYSTTPIEELNEKAETLNWLYQLLSARFERCIFINNDVNFQDRNVVNRRLLSRDGLHLHPTGIQQLLGNMLSALVQTPSLASSSLPCPHLSEFIPLPVSVCASAPLSSSASSSIFLPSSSASSSSRSYRDVLLLPPATPPSSSESSSSFLGRKSNVTSKQSASSVSSNLSSVSAPKYSSSSSRSFNKSRSKKLRVSSKFSSPLFPSHPSRFSVLSLDSSPKPSSSSSRSLNKPRGKKSRFISKLSSSSKPAFPSHRSSPLSSSLKSSSSTSRSFNKARGRKSRFASKLSSPFISSHPSRFSILSLVSSQKLTSSSSRSFNKSRGKNFNGSSKSVSPIQSDYSVSDAVDPRQLLYPSYRPVNGGGSSTTTIYPRKCEKCGNIYKSKQSFCNHNKKCAVMCLEDQVKYPRACDKCNSTYQCKQTFYKHKKLCLLIKKNYYVYPRMCDDCKRTYKCRQSFYKHRKKCSGFRVNVKSKACSVCSRIFNNRQALQKHKKICKVTSRSKYPRQCSFCERTYKTKITFFRHKFSCLELLAKKFLKKINYPRTCPSCFCSFPCPTSYCKHRHFCSVEASSFPCSSTDCQMKFTTKTRLSHHQKTQHVNNSTHFMHFKSFSDFKDWKKKEDQKNYSFQKKVRATKISKEGINTYYYQCMFNVGKRSEKYKKRKTVRKRRYGQIPESSCPSKMTAKVFEDGTVELKYVSCHSHLFKRENRIYHQWPPEVRAAVYKYLDDGVDVNVIREKFELPKNSEEPYPRKEHFMTNRQILRYRYRKRCKERKDSDDAQAIKKHVEGMSAEEKRNILVYKPQGCDTDIGDKDFDHLPNHTDLFIYGFQTERQRQELEEGAKRVLCVDATHKTNRYDFYLINFLVPDEYNNGLVVAHFIVNRLDESIMTLLFRTIKKKSPNLIVNTFMSDDDDALRNGFSNVFTCNEFVCVNTLLTGDDDDTLRKDCNNVFTHDEFVGSNITISNNDCTNFKCPCYYNKPKLLLCKWHVARAWKNQCIKKIKDPTVRTTVYNDLMAILEERNTEVFHNDLLPGFFEKYSDLTYSNFVAYFKNQYCNRVEAWAMCYRNFYHASVDTNMYLEAFHSVLKKRLGRKSNYRMDELLIILEKMEHERYLKLDDRRAKGEPPTDFTNNFDLRHSRGMNIPPDLIEETSNENEWRVKVKKNKSYLVTKFQQCNHFDNCYIRCTNMSCLGLCSHLYRCSCPDEKFICKHIHRVHSHLRRDTHHSLGIVTSNVAEKTISPLDVGEETVEISCSEIQADEDPKVFNSVSPPSQEDNTEFDTLVSQLHSFLKSKNNPNFKSHIIKALKSELIYCESKEVPSRVRKVPSMQCSFSPNQKSPLQPKFFKTLKKKKVPKKLSFKKPNTNELSDLREKLRAFHDKAVKYDAIAVEEEVSVEYAVISSDDEEVLIESEVSSAKNSFDSAGIKSSQVPDLFASRHFSSNNESFTPDLDAITAKYLYNYDKCYVTLIELKSLDSFISAEETNELQKISLFFKKNWLYDSVIDIFFYILCKDKPNMPSYCMPNQKVQLVADNKSIKLCASKMPVVDYKTLQNIFIPFCLNNNHWVLIVIKVQEEKVLFFDPYYKNIQSQHLDVISKWMSVFSLILEKDIFNWVCPYSPPHILQPPDDAVNCGVFVCYYAFKMLEQQSISEFFDTNVFRKSIYDRITSRISRTKP